MNPRVLVVDDDADLREVVSEALADAGYEVANAEDGRAALDLLKKSPHLPAVVLLDVMMPVMNGIELARAMRRDPRLAPLAIVVFTAHADHVRVAEAVGAVASLTKPLKLQSLLDTIERATRAPHAAAALT